MTITDNMKIYASMATTPPEAKKTIAAGRLKGFTDIRPMYRIKKLTEMFGPCGIGWKYVIKSQRIEAAPNGELKAFMDIDLYYKWNGEWSEPIPGIGGNAFLSHERSGDYVNDECFKSALSDAIGTACKSLGMCADVYYAEDRTKYAFPEAKTEKKAAPNPAPSPAPENSIDPDYANKVLETVQAMCCGIHDAESANETLVSIKALKLPAALNKSVNEILMQTTAKLGLYYSGTARSYVQKG